MHPRSALLFCFLLSALSAAAQPAAMLNDPVDVSPDFHDFANTYFLADHLSGFDPATGTGTTSTRVSPSTPCRACSSPSAA